MTNARFLQVSRSEKRKRYFFKVIVVLFLISAYAFALLNFILGKPLVVVFHNLLFGILFTVCYFLSNKHFERIILILGILFQLFIFGHAFYLLPGKQIEAGLGVLTCVLPIFVVGPRLWYFFISNFILYHLVLFNVDYEHIFYFQYLFYIVLFIMTYTLVSENQEYEKELLVQRDKIQQDAQELRAMDQLKTRFFANISHELRTPLTLVLSPIESILKSKELSNRNATYLQLMQQNGRKLLQRINELLELSRLDAKKQTLHKTPVPLNALTKQIFAAYEGAAHLKDIQLNYTNTLSEDLHLLLDGPKVEMILSNFLSNALKFTQKNGTISLAIFKKNQNLRIQVKDSGIGIPPAARTAIFNRFYQVKGVDYQQGSGIGLALCKELANLHNGKVGVESELGQGSTFFVALPFEEIIVPIEKVIMLESPLKRIARVETKSLSPIGKNRPTVLVVEDNLDLRSYMQLMLSEKYQVHVAENGQVALDYLTVATNSLPSLIISDIMMPVMDGMTLLKAIKQNEKWLAIPVIMLTAQKHTDVKIEALRIGVDDYLTKPFKEVELLARVDNLIQNTQQRLLQNRDSAIPPTNDLPKITTADMAWLKTIETKIQDNIKNSQFKLSDLAADMYITPRTLQQKIKKLTGNTPKKYQRNIQLHHARKILKSGAVKTVSELSYELGFEDATYFSKLYQKEFGVRPKAELDWVNA